MIVFMIKRFFTTLFIFSSLFAYAKEYDKELFYSSKVSPKSAWDYLQTSPYEYDNLPRLKVSFRDFFSRDGENLLLKDSKRTVKSDHHFIPPQRKLIFPMGVCLKGDWVINNHSDDYTGYFRSGSRGIVIARAATSLTRIMYNQYRTLALSGKIFPTMNKNEESSLPAANFLLMNDNAGLKNEYFTEANLTNAAPTTITPASLSLALIAYEVGKAFNLTDERRDMRQLYQIAELNSSGAISSPHWMVLKGKKSFRELSHKLNESDYRKEIMEIINKEKKLEFNIYVSKALKNERPIYKVIGHVIFDDYVASAECDQSLHFQHPPYLKKYTMPELDQKLHDNPTLNEIVK